MSDAGDGNKRRPVVLLWMKLELQSVISLADCVSVDLEHFEMGNFYFSLYRKKAAEEYINLGYRRTIIL